MTVHASHRPSSRQPWLVATVLLIGVQGAAHAQPADPNDPGILEPALTATTGVETRIPHTDQAQGSTLLNLVGSQVEQDALGANSLMGHPITTVRSPHDAMSDELDAMASAASSDDSAAMTSAAASLEAILLGTTQGEIFDGFAMLNYNRGAYLPDHEPGEYKLKTLVDSGQTTVGIDGQPRRIWELDVAFLWYDGQFDADTFLMKVPVEAHAFDELRVNYTFYSLEGEDFSPTAVLLDHRLEGSVQFPYKGLDSVWTKVGGSKVTQLSVDYPPLRLLRGVYTWGWREHPPRIQFLQPVYEMVNAHTGQVELEPQGRSFVERNRMLSIDDIGAAAPEKKMWEACQAALTGAGTAAVAAMLDDPGTAPRGTWQDWADLAQDQLEIPDEAWDVLAAEDGLPKGQFGHYRFISVYMNNEMYGRGAVDKAKITGWRQGDSFQVKLINLDEHTHYFRNVDFGPKLHDDIISGGFSAGSHSFEIMNFKPTYGAPKVAEMQWRAGWGFRPHFDVIQQPDVFPRNADRALWRHYYDGSGGMYFGWQYSEAARGGDFVFNPPNFIIESPAHPSLQRLQEGGRVDGLVIGQHTEGYGVAKMCSHVDHPLGGFCETDIGCFNPHGVLNADSDGNGVNDALWFPPFLRNPDPVSGGDIIPPTPAWKPFLWINPTNGTLWLDPSDPSQGAWADLTYSHGAPIAPGLGLSATVEQPRCSGQVFYQFDDLYHDNAIFSPHPTFEPTTAPAVNLGHGTLAISGKVPFFSAAGSLATGGTATFSLADGTPSTTAWLVLSLTAAETPFKGGILVPAGAIEALPFTTDGDGALAVPVAGGGGPLEIFAQFALSDASAIGGFALSNALDVLIAP
ncbi:MAG: hypothetical protein DRQ55_00615 [Planctomycetota bacterium]|nr:MAG: hypothetical protein DRQ55_00615 [Planctomycetota bacterium]